MKKIIANSILIVFILLVSIKYLPPLFNYQVYGVSSGSMEPNYPIGSLIIVEKCDFEDIRVGDVITFKQENSSYTKTHRVVNIDQNTLQFTTKGDNNKEEDARRVSKKAFIGKVVCVFAIVGYLFLFFDTPMGIVVIIALAIMSIYLSRNDADKQSKT
ncbi:MAG: signal peptidase I [Erysipelotrichia bacterium]|nr:signal peptidase I [Erysipelotrichia bacterium]